MHKILGLVAVGLMVASPLQAQQPAKVRRIGYLSQSDAPPTANIEAFRRGLRELGYIEGENISVEYRLGARGPRLTELATELVHEKVEVIVAGGPAVGRAKKATETVPIVFLYSGDPVEAGFIDSLAKPGRNMTGITWLAFELVGKRLEILKEAIPKVSRVAILSSPAHPGEQRELRRPKPLPEPSESRFCIIRCETRRRSTPPWIW
jgi:putative ABC transport system substrate-binding protein